MRCVALSTWLHMASNSPNLAPAALGCPALCIAALGSLQANRGSHSWFD